eukprot:9230254-Alexandrium_andersonii.AAC.1
MECELPPARLHHTLLALTARHAGALLFQIMLAGQHVPTQGHLQSAPRGPTVDMTNRLERLRRRDGLERL